MNSLRPDEQAAAARTERSNRTKSLLEMGATAATGFAGAKLASKALPWLNELIPTDLAVKGLSKIHPKLGQFLKAGMSSGLDPKEGIEFLKNGIEKAEESAKPTQQSKGIVEKYSPELHQFIVQKMQEGRSPLEAIGMATLPGEKKFTNVIKKMTQETKMPLSAIIESSYGPSQGQSQKQVAQSAQQMSPQPVQQTQRVPSAPQQPGQGKQALMAVLQNIQQRLAQP